MNKKTTTIEYLEYYEHYVTKFGKERMIVLMQVGSFYESYSTLKRGPDLNVLEELTDASIAHKGQNKNVIDDKNPLMWGFPIVAKLKFINILIDNGFRIVIIDQVTPKPNIRREVTAIHTPSTYLENTYKPKSNFICLIFIEEMNQSNGCVLSCIGMSAIDVSTGDVYLHESYSVVQDDKLGLDETVRFINGLMPKEIVILKNELKCFTNKYIVDYLELEGKFHQFKEPNILHNKINYQKKLLELVYPDRKNMVSIIDTLGLSQSSYARMSFVNLLTYIYDHVESLIKGIKEPVFHLQDMKLVLGNDAINQLDIINNKPKDNIQKHNYNGLYDVVNKAHTGMGKRYIKMMLISPHTNPDTLNNIYNIVDILLQNDYFCHIESYLKTINDIERLNRKLSINMLHPSHLVDLISSYKTILNMFSKIKKNKNLTTYIKTKHLRKTLKKLNTIFTDNIDLDKAKLYTINDIKENIFNEGIHPYIDNLQKQIGMGQDSMELLREKLNGMIDDKNARNEKISLKHNRNEGYYFQLTIKRYNSLKINLDKINNININNICINIDDFKVTKTNNNIKLSLPMLKNQTSNIEELQTQLSHHTHLQYINFLKNINTQFGNSTNSINTIVTMIDYYVTISKVARKYNYVKPTIKNKNNSNGYLSAKEIRHPIVERIIEHEYVPHDIELGLELKGMLMYGLNSAGKSVLMKSIGLSIVLAQAGFYVPAKKFTYYPYKALYTRITGSDNLLRGLSSYGVEMVELNSILKRSNESTLVIGDEVCRGTEYISGNAIVASTILKLSDIGSTFVFATHLHELVEIDDIKERENIKAFHLTVEHDVKNDKLIYDRELKPGSGDRIYGITVAKYIIKDADFIEKALTIKNKLLNRDTKSPVISTKTSRYNANLLIDKCGMCGKRGLDSKQINLETHHINHQKDCDINGFVKNKPHIKKNAMYNLIVLCNTCHDVIHINDISGSIKMTSSGQQIIVKKH
jgi:DNA mismatch repair protein MutS